MNTRCASLSQIYGASKISVSGGGRLNTSMLHVYVYDDSEITSHVGSDSYISTYDDHIRRIMVYTY